MSGHGHDDADTAHAGHDDQHEPETSSDDFPADEPRSPAWLPLLGGALFLAGIFALVLVAGEDKAPGQAAPGIAAAPVAQPERDPAQRPAMRVPPSFHLPVGHAPVAPQP